MAICRIEHCATTAASLGLCKKHYNQDYHRRNREKVLKRQKEWYVDNHDAQKARSLANYRADRPAWKARNRNYYLKARFGMTLEDYDRMHHEQRGLCAVCGMPETNGRYLAVDHCHTTGRIRALLCGRCNLTLGKMKDDPALALRMAQYLVEHGDIAEVA